jgi:hypothetical protein
MKEKSTKIYPTMSRAEPTIDSNWMIYYRKHSEENDSITIQDFAPILCDIVNPKCLTATSIGTQYNAQKQ